MNDRTILELTTAMFDDIAQTMETMAAAIRKCASQIREADEYPDTFPHHSLKAVPDEEIPL